MRRELTFCLGSLLLSLLMSPASSQIHGASHNEENDPRECLRFQIGRLLNLTDFCELNAEKIELTDSNASHAYGGFDPLEANPLSDAARDTNQSTPDVYTKNPILIALPFP